MMRRHLPFQVLLLNFINLLTIKKVLPAFAGVPAGFEPSTVETQKGLSSGEVEAEDSRDGDRIVGGLEVSAERQKAWSFLGKFSLSRFKSLFL